MEHDVPNRFDRIVSILIQLQSKKTVKAQELADRFQVSLRTIYRDIRSLNSAGVPILGEAGTGYSMMEGYRLPPVMFTREEAGSFAAAEKLMEHFTDETIGKHFQSAMYKIKSVLRGTEKEWIEILDSHISIHSARKAFNESIPNALEILFESVARKKQVILDHKAVRQAAPTQRFIEVVGLFHENQYWYILGYCHLRKDYRQFRIDRIHGISSTDLPFSRSHGTIAELRENKDTWTKQRVILRVDAEIVEYIKYDRDSYGFVSERPVGKGQIEMIFETHGEGHAFVRWILMFADHIQLVEPVSVKLRMREILENALAKINPSL